MPDISRESKMKIVNAAAPNEQNSTTSEESKTCQPIAIVKPLFMCMTFVGIQTVVHETPETDFSWFTICGICWCTATALLVWINIARLLPSYADVDGFNEDTFIKIVIFVWYLQCGINIAVCLRASIKSNLLHRLYDLWNKYCQKRSFERHATSLRKVVWGLTGGYIFFAVVNIILISYIMYSTDPQMRPFTSVLYSPIGEYEELKIFLMMYQSYIAGTWILPLWLFFLVCYINKLLLEDSRVAILEHTDKKTRKYSGEVETVRMLHEEACTMVECADDTFNVFVALGLGTDIPMGCFEMYMMIWPNTGSQYVILFNGFLLMMNVFHLCVILWSASRVHTEAHASFKQFHKIRTCEMSEPNKFQLMLFLSRLRGEPIGMTAWNMFTVDRPSILTIISIILTYFVILIELRMPTQIQSQVTVNLTLTTIPYEVEP